MTPEGITKSGKCPPVGFHTRPVAVLLSHSEARTGPHCHQAGEKEILEATTARSGPEQPCHRPPCVGTILASPSSAQPPKRPFQNANGSTPRALCLQPIGSALPSSSGQAQPPASGIAPVSGSWRPPRPSSPFHRPQPQLLSAAPQARMFSPHLHTWVRACLSV